MKFNTSISKLMQFVNNFYEKGLNDSYKINFIKLLSPFAPHLCEELWSLAGHKTSVFNEKWPNFDQSKIVKNDINIAVQVNGKVRCTITVSVNDDKSKVLSMARDNSNVKNYINDKKIIKEIYIPGKIINFVVN